MAFGKTNKNAKIPYIIDNMLIYNRLLIAKRGNIGMIHIIVCEDSDSLFKTKDIKTPYTLIAQLRFLPRVVNSRLFRVPWSVKIVVHFYLNSARESIT